MSMTELYYWHSLHLDIVTEDRSRQEQLVARAIGGSGKDDD